MTSIQRITIAEAARKTGVAASTIRDVARRLGLGQRIDGVRALLLTDREVERILQAKRESAGRPPVL